MSTYSNRLQPALQNLLQRVRSVPPPEIVVHNAYIGGHSERRAWRSRVEESNNSIYSAASLALRMIFSVS